MVGIVYLKGEAKKISNQFNLEVNCPAQVSKYDAYLD
jgi:hypothetical protein